MLIHTNSYTLHIGWFLSQIVSSKNVFSKACCKCMRLNTVCIRNYQIYGHHLFVTISTIKGAMHCYEAT